MSSRHSHLRNLILLLTLAVGVAACDSDSRRGGKVDEEWHRRALVEGHLSRWLAVAPSDNGILHVTASRTWQTGPEKTADLTSQSRLVYVLLSGYEITGDRRYLDIARQGADFIVQKFHDPANGGFFQRVDASGHPVDSAKHTYGHAFAIFALAHAFRVTKDERYREAATAAWQMVNLKLRDGEGGFHREASSDFAPSPSQRTQNPVMHLFEAMLALHEATGSPIALEGARSIGNFVTRRLLRGTADGGAYIAEWYDAKWEPLRTKEEGGYIDLGHQFEWAYLLNAAAYQGVSGIYEAVAERVLNYAVKTGYDELAGGTFRAVYPDGTVAREKGYWQQSECLRTLMRFAVLYGKKDLWRRYEQTLELVKDEFIDTANGGWRLSAKSACERSACADVQPDAYHMTAMHQEALALSKRSRQR